MASLVKTNTHLLSANGTYERKNGRPNATTGKRNNNSRRRKRRRTEDFSSSEDDSSSSSSDSEDEENSLERTNSDGKTQMQKCISSNVRLGEVIEEEEFQPDLEIGKIFKIDNSLAKKLQLLNSQNSKKVDIGVSMDYVRNKEAFLNEFILDNILADIPENKGLRKNLIEKLSELTKNDLGIELGKSKKEYKKSSVDIRMEKNSEAKNKLLDEFISLMMKNYDDDLDTLRKASDLSLFSLSILATTLRESGSVFDYESLQAILN